jgi:hypothetical protein
MAAGNWIMFDSAKEFIGDGSIDLDTDTFKCVLCTASYTPNRSTQSDYGDVSNELTTGAGYTSGGATLTNVAWGQVSGTATFDCEDIAWTASGGPIGPCRVAVIYDDTSSGDLLLCYCVLDSSDVTVTDGNDLTIQIHTSGVFTLAGMGS